MTEGWPRETIQAVSIYRSAPPPPAPSPPSRRPLPSIDWYEEETGYGRFAPRATRVLDGNGAVILHLIGPEGDLRVDVWSIVAGDVDDMGGVRVTVRCVSPARYGKELQLRWQPDTMRWYAGETSLEGPALAGALTRLVGPAGSLDVDAIVDAIGDGEAAAATRTSGRSRR